MYLFLGAGTDTGWTDRGFPIGAGANWGGATYKLARFSQKLQQINKLLVYRGPTWEGGVGLP